jgi:hypothetical protein
MGPKMMGGGWDSSGMQCNDAERTGREGEASPPGQHLRGLGVAEQSRTFTMITSSLRSFHHCHPNLQHLGYVPFFCVRQVEGRRPSYK